VAAPFTLGALAVVFDEAGAVLLTRRLDREQWCPPGGGCKEDEPPWEAVVRETKEETGLAVSVESLVGLYYRCGRPDLVFVFRCRAVGGRLSQSDEVRELGYFPLDALPDGLPGPYAEEIRDAAQPAGSAKLRIVPPREAS
jgi:8-oxo-dGTP diphosphatase